MVKPDISILDNIRHFYFGLTNTTHAQAAYAVLYTLEETEKRQHSVSIGSNEWNIFATLYEGSGWHLNDTQLLGCGNEIFQ